MDKLLHAMAGALIFGIAAALVGRQAAAAVLIVCAFGKEAWDRRHEGHTADPADTVATIMGGAACAAAMEVW